MTDELWTLAQLPDQVARLLGDGYDGQRNGRVRELPNGRAIRWYTTIGLVDRPIAAPGRVALYGRRHALQLAAIKRLQARGRSLAEIQRELLGASEEQLIAIAEPTELSDATEPAETTEANQADVKRVDGAFWRQRPVAAEAVTEAVHGFRLGDSVTVVLNGADRVPDADELHELAIAAAPLLAALDRLGLAQRKEDR